MTEEIIASKMKSGPAVSKAKLSPGETKVPSVNNQVRSTATLEKKVDTHPASRSRNGE
jgi:hypothetical protein